jgi:hypothetical protein
VTLNNNININDCGRGDHIRLFQTECGRRHTFRSSSQRQALCWYVNVRAAAAAGVVVVVVMAVAVAVVVEVSGLLAWEPQGCVRLQV